MSTDSPPAGLEPRQLLTWLLPRVDLIEQRVQVLSDSAQHEQHGAATRDALTLLRDSVEFRLTLQHRLPSRTGRTDDR